MQQLGIAQQLGIPEVEYFTTPVSPVYTPWIRPIMSRLDLLLSIQTSLSSSGGSPIRGARCDCHKDRELHHRRRPPRESHLDRDSEIVRTPLKRGQTPKLFLAAPEALDRYLIRSHPLRYRHHTNKGIARPLMAEISRIRRGGGEAALSGSPNINLRVLGTRCSLPPLFSSPSPLEPSPAGARRGVGVSPGGE